jgi:hypothetical protein
MTDATTRPYGFLRGLAGAVLSAGVGRLAHGASGGSLTDLALAVACAVCAMAVLGGSPSAWGTSAPRRSALPPRKG